MGLHSPQELSISYFTGLGSSIGSFYYSFDDLTS